MTDKRLLVKARVGNLSSEPKGGRLAQTITTYKDD